jgi:hypothetical protein
MKKDNCDFLIREVVGGSGRGPFEMLLFLNAETKFFVP